MNKGSKNAVKNKRKNLKEQTDIAISSTRKLRKKFEKFSEESLADKTQKIKEILGE